jgi:NACHT domain
MLDRTRAGLRSGQPARTLLPDPASTASDREPEVRYLHTGVRVPNAGQGIDPMASRGGLAARAGWLAAFTGPPVVAAALLRHVIADHQAEAIALGLAYEGVVAGTSFATGVAGDLATRWQKRLADRADLLLLRRVSRFNRQYREFVLADVRFIDLKDLATVGYFTPELDEVYVDVSLAFRAPHKVSAALLAGMPAAITERRALGEFLDRGEPEVLAVIGAPGSGKTTLLRHTARQACLARRSRRRRVPILLYLRDHVREIVARPNAGVADLVRGTLGELGSSEPAGWFEQQLSHGNCVVLLDGLDEVARQEDRGNVAAWVERQIRQYPRNDYVITSRPYGYRSARIDGASVLQVRDFTADQVARFVRGWYKAVARRNADDSMERARSAADDLLRRLDDAPALHDLTVNPLLLTMIVNVHRDGGSKLPGSRAELYGEICQVVLWRRQEAKKLASDLDGVVKEALLRGLAYAMMQRRLRDLPRADVLAEISPALKRLPRQVTADDYLADVSSNGLLAERESGQYSFAHHTFQEYLAAAYIRDKGLVDVLAKSVDDVWWRETALLYAALADANVIVRACLASASVSAVTLAIHCADQGSVLAPDMVGRIEDLISGASGPGTDPERRHLIAGALLARHLGEQIRTSNGALVCTRPVPVALYRLFLQDGQRPEPDSPVAENAGDRPSFGMAASGAAAFVEWANGITGSGAVYRLPSRAEVNDMTRQRLITTDPPDAASRSVWLASDRALPELWVPPGTPHPYTIDAETLTKHVENDFKHSVPTLTRLLLLRSAVALRALVPDLDHLHGLFLSPDMASRLSRDRAILDFNKTSARYLPGELVRSPVGPGLDIDRIRALAGALDSAVESRPLADDDVGMLAGARDPVRAKHIARARTLALQIAQACDGALDRDLARSDVVAYALGFDGDRSAGRAISRALSSALNGSAHSAGEWVADFSEAFVKAAGAEKNSWVVSPDALSEKLGAAAQTLEEMATGTLSGKSAPSALMVEVASRLQRTAAPVFDRRKQVTPAGATSMRLAALSLAAEADRLPHSLLSKTFREIAAGVTLLERRASGAAPVTETILLATE